MGKGQSVKEINPVLQSNDQPPEWYSLNAKGGSAAIAKGLAFLINKRLAI
jgi:hypothetical protein